MPVFFVAGRPYKSATVMLVPETAVDKYDCFIFGKNDVWTSRKIADVFSISQSF